MGAFPIEHTPYFRNELRKIEGRLKLAHIYLVHSHVDYRHKAIKLIDRLEEIARIEKVLKELLFKPPLETFEALKSILAHAEKLNYKSNNTSHGRQLLQKVSFAIKTRSDIETAADEFDYEVIVVTKPKLIELQSLYGKDFGAEEIRKATIAQAEIETEWKNQIPKLQRAIQKGAVVVPDETTNLPFVTVRYESASAVFNSQSDSGLEINSMLRFVDS